MNARAAFWRNAQGGKRYIEGGLLRGQYGITGCGRGNTGPDGRAVGCYQNWLKINKISNNSI